MHEACRCRVTKCLLLFSTCGINIGKRRNLTSENGGFFSDDEFSYTFLHRGQCQQRYSCNHTDRAVLSTLSWLYYSSEKAIIPSFHPTGTSKMLRSLLDKAQKKAEVGSHLEHPPRKSPLKLNFLEFIKIRPSRSYLYAM